MGQKISQYCKMYGTEKDKINVSFVISWPNYKLPEKFKANSSNSLNEKTTKLPLNFALEPIRKRGILMLCFKINKTSSVFITLSQLRSPKHSFRNASKG